MLHEIPAVTCHGACLYSELLSHMQDDIEKLDKEIADRHAEELAALEKRLAADASDEGTLKLAESLYETKLSNDQDKVRAPFPPPGKLFSRP